MILEKEESENHERTKKKRKGERKKRGHSTLCPNCMIRPNVESGFNGQEVYMRYWKKKKAKTTKGTKKTKEGKEKTGAQHAVPQLHGAPQRAP